MHKGLEAMRKTGIAPVQDEPAAEAPIMRGPPVAVAPIGQPAEEEERPPEGSPFPLLPASFDEAK